jgi:hypothetical protein
VGRVTGAIALTATLYAGTVSAQVSVPIESVLRPEWVCSISSVFAIDVVANGARSTAVSTVAPFDTPSGPVWRGMHVNADPVAQTVTLGDRAAHDVMDVARHNLRPISSEHRAAGRRTAFEFDYMADAAAKLPDGDHPAEDIPLAGTFAIPEGPGSEILFQAVPWSEGLRLRAHQVDRWRGSGPRRLKPVTIEVSGSTNFELAGKSLDVWIVHTVPDDRSFSVVQWVTKARPHVTVHTEYRTGTDPVPMVSEVRMMANGVDCS